MALNHQTNDLGLKLNRIKFSRLNGNGGYVEKPARGIFFTPAGRKLKVCVLSGHNLPKPEYRSDRSEVIDPYVRVSVRDGLSESQVYSTRYVLDNGFAPTWNEEFEFTVDFPELALVRRK